ncbi:MULTISPECIES: flagellar biosynthesis protein FlhB [unclassified Dehalobacter]|uniref:flagellar biosynthesis protein FlhB n=1 Tax=unclassified Dehalobacter TaxID=2635733 RepID=UPI00036DAB1C|nr:MULTISPECIES: flagellar biosynthesis protein FlhB [unclassified Dehalobacter]RJE48754.1 flagellar biosynthesis protein FlhB [Dehalobacter sp. MCB1]TCX51846.1 flagellar biosynthesis protein FlhB [Dehalobacter sp. 14DCB1]TCX52906.1 flagellar biosynthesis protein FlhB [Dehalobacter sp. 12DCB1]
MECIAEKRFPATPKKKQDARKKGQILKSQELTSAVMLLAIIGLLKIWLPYVFQRLANIFTYTASLSVDWNIQSLWKVVIDVSWQCLLILAPVFAVALVIAIAVNFLQTGPVFITEPMIPKFSRMSPVEGVKRMFGLKALVNLVKSLFKVLVIGYFLIDVIRKNIDVFPALQGAEVGQSLIFLSGLLFEMAWKIALAFLVIAFADFLYQWWDYEKNLRMSQEEIKEEYKQTEGDPLIKSQIKKRQRMMAMRRMMEDLKQADVVITNPTHYAVALKYDTAKYPAPYVVAKGQNEIALRIKAVAEENNIVIMENKPLARTLYSQVELGQSVPKELYKAVAEVLAFVFRLNKKRRSYSA